MQSCCLVFFFNDPATTEIYTLSLHDALPILDSEDGDSEAVGLVLSSLQPPRPTMSTTDRKSTRLNSSHVSISYAVFCLKKKNPAEIRIVVTAPVAQPSAVPLYDERRHAAQHD